MALSRRWHVPGVFAGELLTEAIIQASALGIKARAYVEEKTLVPDEVMMKLMQKRFEQPDVMLKGWVLAGFPRTTVQAEAFDALLEKFGLEAAKVASLEAMTGILISRLAAQNLADQNLADQNLADQNNLRVSVSEIRQRLTCYQEEIAPVVEYYQQQDRLIKVNGNRSAAEVTNELSRIEEEETGAARFIQDEATLNLLLEQASVVVVDCVASWCGPCKLVSPLIDRLAADVDEAVQERGQGDGGDRATVVKLDFDNNRQVAKRFGLKGMPSVMFFKNGELQKTLTGVKTYQIYRDVVAALNRSDD
ncbi:MAG: adenylate kinase [Phormidesmis sp. RL_2_1]|nr:adenylate kinase [Phormidesmis sp. RL_2_1]